ncbi:MAG: hypothetical protein EXX96DRAFT_585929 [Benjaminiella poitrasii]|nr:MAG: hypothetical protein EXX96DRAFT_585929 [Benjaminiella poitrasii]
MDGEIGSCECQDFRYRRKACKHMFLLKLYNRSLNIFTEEARQLQTVATNTNTIKSAESSAEQHNIDRKRRNILLSLGNLRHCRRKINNINEEETLDDIY